MPRQRKSRIYTRNRGEVVRYYGDFRDFADVGGGRESLTAPGERSATTDRAIAEKVAADRVQELQERRRGRTIHGIEEAATLGAFAEHHLVQKTKSGRVTENTVGSHEHRLRSAVTFFGTDRELTTISTRDVQRYVNHLGERSNGRGGKLSAKSVLEYLGSMSNLYRRARADGVVPAGYDPVGDLMEKPQPECREARWLEVPDASLLLEAARHHRPEDIPGFESISFLYALVGTFLLTGGRKSEVLGLEVEDVSFDRKTVTFRPNRWRRLKTRTSHRVAPLWPQLEEILRPHVFGGSGPPGSLLFPSARLEERGSEGMIRDTRKALDAIGERAGWKSGEIRTRIFRHTYCATRLQTLDHGAPVSEYTVAHELGHGGHAMIRRVYGHLGTARHRADVVEYRAEQHAERLGERLASVCVKRVRPTQCRGTSSAGGRCANRKGLSDEGLCLWHDPRRQEEASKAREKHRQRG